MGFAIFSSLVASLVVGILIGCKLSEKDCADCAVGNTESKWWRKALALAEYRKSEKKRVSN